jgi:polyisoprenoid-binding protein YceI
MDRPDANPDRVRQELLSHEVVVEEMGGETSLGFIASAVINRKDFGITWGLVPMGKNGYLTSNEVKITLDITADLSP